jgi:hypothetical protein
MPFPVSACTLQLSVFRAGRRIRHISSSRLNRQQQFEHWSRKAVRLMVRQGIAARCLHILSPPGARKLLQPTDFPLYSEHTARRADGKSGLYADS